MKTITLDAKVFAAIAGHYDEAFRLIEDRFDRHAPGDGRVRA